MRRLVQWYRGWPPWVMPSWQQAALKRKHLYRVSWKYLDKRNIKTKKKIHINTFPEMNAFWVSLKDYNQQCTPGKVIFYVHWSNTFRVQVPNLVTVELLLFITSQFITNTWNILHLNQSTHGHVWSWTITPFDRVWGGFWWFDRHQKCVGQVSSQMKI
jgi:hypothetical protein